MDVTSVAAAVSSNGRCLEVELLLDSGQLYTCLPESVWTALGLTKLRTVRLHRADGRPRDVAVSECSLEFDRRTSITPVILGEVGDLAILGTLTLAELGYVLDPLTREVFPAQLRLGSVGPLGKQRIPSEVGLVGAVDSHESSSR